MWSLHPTERLRRPGRVSTRRRKARQPTLTSSEDESSEIVSVDLDQIRQARVKLYTKTTEERTLDHKKRMSSREHRNRDVGSNDRRGGASTVKSRDAGESHTTHRHRRRRRKDREEAGRGEDGFVYKTMEKSSDRVSAPSTRSRRDRAVLGGYGSNSASKRIHFIKTSRSRTPQQQSLYPEHRRRRTVLDESSTMNLRRRNGEHVSAAASISERSRVRVKRSASLGPTSSNLASRPGLLRSQTSTSRKPRALERMDTVPEETKSLSGLTLQRSASVFGYLFRPSRPSVPETKVECLTCLSDDIPISRAPKLACGHRMCHSCLKRIFTMSVTDPAHMPPKCCTADCIPLKHVEKIFDTKFKIKWNRKYQEYTTKNRLYCPAKGCGTWIQPRDIKATTSGGTHSPRKYGKCPRCRTKVCATCNGKWHSSKECPKDEETIRFAEMAKAEGWQRCYNCSATVELKEGCNHMTCRCTAEFCMICGAKWKTCDCPWFNYAAVENDRLNHMNIAQVRQEAARGNRVLDQPRAYHEELERRREQEQRDEAFARQIQDLYIGDPNNPRANRHADNHHPNLDVNIFGIGNARGHFLNEHFVHRAANILAAPQTPAQVAAANRIVDEIQQHQRTDAGLPAPQPTSPPRRAATMAAMQIPRLRRADTRARAPPPPPPPPPAAPLASPTGRTREVGTGSHDVDVGLGSDPRRVDGERRRHSMLAGLTRRSTVGRVDEWRRHVSGDAGVGVAPW